MSAALAGTDMSFTSGKHGPNAFSTLGDAARKEAVKKGSACACRHTRTRKRVLRQLRTMHA